MFQNLKDRSLAFLTIFSGAFSLGLMIYIWTVVPRFPAASIHSSLSSTIIAVELVHNRTELYNLLGHPGDIKHQIYTDKYIKGVDLDYLFIFCYSIFLLSVIEQALRLNAFPGKFRVYSYIAVIFCILLDVMENYKLVDLLSAAGEENLDSDILITRTFSLLKWFVLFSICGGIGVLFWLARGNLILKLPSILLVTAFFTSIPGLFRYYLIELSFLIVSAGFLIYFLYSIVSLIYLLFRKKI